MIQNKNYAGNERAVQYNNTCPREEPLRGSGVGQT